MNCTLLSDSLLFLMPLTTDSNAMRLSIMVGPTTNSDDYGNTTAAPVPTNATQDVCTAGLDSTLFYFLILIPAALIVITFSFTQKRRRLFLNILNGRPGLIYPMNILGKSDRICYVCAMGATANAVFRVLFMPSDYEGSNVIGTVFMLLLVLVIGLVYFPVFATLTTGSLLGFGLGSLYIWVLTSVDLVSFIQLTGCDASSATKAQAVFISLPNFLCLLFLSVRIPYRMYQDYSYSKDLTSSLKMRRHESYTMEDLKRSNMGLHVRSLLRIPEKRSRRVLNAGIVFSVQPIREHEIIKNPVGMKAKIFDFVLDNTYRPHPNFQYSARFLSTHFLAFLLLYSVAFYFYTIIFHFYELYDERDSEISKPLEYLLNSLVTAVTLSLVLGVFGIMRMFTTYRETMFALHRGEMKDLLKNTRNNYVLFYAMRYSGAQVVSVFWGFVIHIVILLLPCAVVSFTLLALREEYSIYTRWLVSLVQTFWPIAVISLIIYLVQLLMTKYCFLAHQRHLVLDNRRAFFITSYFIFFYNLFVGIFISLFRILKSMVVGALLLPRLDTSIMPKDFTTADIGYMTYLGFMKLENDYTHPVMLTFIRLLQSLAKESHDAPTGSRRDKVDVSRRHKVIVFKWQILFSLVNNPGIRKYRKGYFQKIKMARELGVAVARSDTTFAVISEGELKKAKELADQRDRRGTDSNLGGVGIGKIVGAAGEKLGNVRNKIQERIRVRDGRGVVVGDGVRCDYPELNDVEDRDVISDYNKSSSGWESSRLTLRPSALINLDGIEMQVDHDTDSNSDNSGSGNSGNGVTGRKNNMGLENEAQSGQLEPRKDKSGADNISKLKLPVEKAREALRTVLVSGNRRQRLVNEEGDREEYPV